MGGRPRILAKKVEEAARTALWASTCHSPQTRVTSLKSWLHLRARKAAPAATAET